MISILMTNFTLGLYRGLPWNQVFGGNPTLQNAAAPYLEPGRQSYSDPTIAGGGQIYCQVSHAAAYVAFLTGRRPAEVFARFDQGGAEVDVYDVLSLRLDDGTLVSLASTGATMLSERNFEIRVYGTEGMILMELWKGQFEFHDSQSRVVRYPPLAAADVYPMFAPAENLVDVVRGVSSNRSPGELGLFATEVAQAAIESCADAAKRRTTATGVIRFAIGGIMSKDALTDEQIEQYRNEGFLVVERLFDADDLARVDATIRQMTDRGAAGRRSQQGARARARAGRRPARAPAHLQSLRSARDVSLARARCAAARQDRVADRRRTSTCSTAS